MTMYPNPKINSTENFTQFNRKVRTSDYLVLGKDFHEEIYMISLIPWYSP